MCSCANVLIGCHASLFVILVMPVVSGFRHKDSQFPTELISFLNSALLYNDNLTVAKKALCLREAASGLAGRSTPARRHKRAAEKIFSL